MAKKSPIRPIEERMPWWDHPPGTYELKAADGPGWVVGEVLDRWYQGMSHLTRARMLVHCTVDLPTAIDLDANWKMAVIDFSAGVEAWSKLPEVKGFGDFKRYLSYRHSIAHILLNTGEHVTISESPLGFEGTSYIIPRTDRGDQATGGSRFPFPGISQGYFRESIAIADGLCIRPLALLMFEFWDDHLSQYPEFEIALDLFMKRVEQSRDFIPLFRDHVLEHRTPMDTCEYC